MAFIDLHNIFKDNSVILSIPNCFIIMKLQSFAINITKPIRSSIFNVNKIVTHIIQIPIFLTSEIVKILIIYIPLQPM